MLKLAKNQANAEQHSEAELLLFEKYSYSYPEIIVHILKNNRAYFNHLLRAVPVRSALLEKQNAFFSTKNSKNTCRSGGCSILNALNLGK